MIQKFLSLFKKKPKTKPVRDDQIEEAYYHLQEAKYKLDGESKYKRKKDERMSEDEECYRRDLILLCSEICYRYNGGRSY